MLPLKALPAHADTCAMVMEGDGPTAELISQMPGNFGATDAQTVRDAWRCLKPLARSLHTDQQYDPPSHTAPKPRPKKAAKAKGKTSVTARVQGKTDVGPSYTHSLLKTSPAAASKPIKVRTYPPSCCTNHVLHPTGAARGGRERGALHALFYTHLLSVAISSVALNHGQTRIF